MKLKAILIAACAVMIIGAAPVLSARTLLRENALISYYGEDFHGQPTSSGELYDMQAMTAAHRTLPFGTMLEITNIENGNSVIVRVNDRGPLVDERELDVSRAAAERLGIVAAGVGSVSVYILEEGDISRNQDARPATVPSVASPAQPPQPAPADARPMPAPPMLFGQGEPIYELPSTTPPARPAPPPPAQPAPAAAQQPPPPAQPAPAAAQQPQPQPAQPAPAAAQQPQPQPAQPAVTQQPPPPEQPAQPPQPVTARAEGEAPDAPVWRIQLGSFSREENAIRLVREIRSIGLEPAYERNGRLIRVVLVSIADSDLDGITSRLLDAGLYDYIIRRER